MNTFLVLMIFFGPGLATSYLEQAENSTCYARDLEPGRLLSCVDIEDSPVSTVLGVPSGSSCNMVCPHKDVNAWVTCDDGRWSDYYIKYCDEAVVSKKRHVIKKRGFRFRARIRIRFRGGIRIRACFFKGCKPRDTTAPILACPPNQEVEAEKLQTEMRVSWPEPTASDNKDGIIKPTRRGKASGSYFSGKSVVSYYARDKAGNMARCSFTVTVKVKRCPHHIPVSDGYYQCQPGTDPLYGAVCTFGCYSGFQLVGNSQLECMYTGVWNNFPPSCQKKTCPTLQPSVGNLKYLCTDENKYRSVCTYFCEKGYDITPGMSRVRVCTSNGTWRGDKPTCKDTDPPRLMNCPHTVIAYADRNSTHGVITWQEPYATDNHDSVVNVTKEGSISPGDEIAAGSFKVKYKATDSAGNNAKTCTTNIIMKVLSCPVVHATPFQSVSCPWGSKYGSQCEFNCGPGTERNGSQVAVCERSGSGEYGYWTFGDMQPFCKVLQSCKRELNAPKNGAIACDYWLGGKFCQMMCKSGYDVRRGSAFYEMIVCGDSGEWFLTGGLPLPDCAGTRMANGGKLRMSASYYFNGDCTNPSTRDEIKRQFIETLNKSKYALVCQMYAKDCTVDNVQIKCGSVGKKRSAEMRIDFDIAASFDSSTFVDGFVQLRRNQFKISNAIRNAQASGFLNFNVSADGLMEIQDIGNSELSLECPERTSPSYTTISCVECAPGTYYDVITETCPMCPRGFYQPLSGQDHCNLCPVGMTTKAHGAQDLSHCESGCEPGSWSADGTPKCSLCPVGTFSDQFGSSQCTECPGSSTTVGEGASKRSQCQEFDLQLSNGSVVSVPFSAQDGANQFLFTAWVYLEHTSNHLEINISSANGTERLIIVISSKVRVSNTSRTIETSQQLTSENWHTIALVMDNDDSMLYIDGQISFQSSLKFELQTKMKLTLTGSSTLSQLNIWYYNVANFSQILSMTSKCSNNISGEILNWKNFEKISNYGTLKQMPSECDDFDNCRSNPCRNGRCIDKRNGYICECAYGFYGDNCEWNIDDCVDHACENNATCVDGAAEYTCQCSYGFKGELCEIVMVDGSWGQWSEWSSCSVTCGNGTQQRWRVCNDPAPDNGGLECPDNSTDSRPCILDSCPECAALETLEHTIWTCINDSVGVNCTVDCADDYDFDHTIKPYYFCGQDTFYLWDFQTDDNPYGKTPYCSKIQDGNNIQVGFSASYKDLSCDSSTMYSETKTKIPETVQHGLKNLNCIASGTCSLDKAIVTGCSRRSKRSTTSSSAGFQLSLSCDPNIHGSEECYIALYTSFDDLQTSIQNDSFDTTVQGSLYEIDTTSIDATSTVLCPTGSVAVQFYCVPCGPGRYLKNDECVKCDFGTYQDLSGQLSCKECPDDTTTPGRESRSVTECSVEIPEASKESIYVTLGVLCGVVLSVVIAMTVFYCRRFITMSPMKENSWAFKVPKKTNVLQNIFSKKLGKNLDKPYTMPQKNFPPVEMSFVSDDRNIEVIYLPH